MHNEKHILEEEIEPKSSMEKEKCPWCGEPKGTCIIPNIDYSISEDIK